MVETRYLALYCLSSKNPMGVVPILARAVGRPSAIGFFMPLKPLTPPPSPPQWRKPPEPAQAPAPVPVRWQLQRLLDAPHRLGFFSAALGLSITALWWLAVLALRWSGTELAWAVAPGLAHGMLLSMGFMPLFIVGFLFTAGPRWLQVPELPTRVLLPAVAAYFGALLVALGGFHVSNTVAALGLAGMVLAWGHISWLYGRLWYSSQAEDKVHGSLILLACFSGWLGMLLACIGVWTGNDTLVRSGIQMVLWLFIGTVFASVSHRMIPFFTASAIPFLDAWRPMWLLWCMVAALWFEGIGALADLWIWPLPSAWRWAQVAIEGPAALLMLWLAIRWGLVQSLKIRLLAMLHGGFVWLGIALLLQALSHAWMALSNDQQSLGLAPLHALTMGYLGATLFAMATRVAAGHSGRPLAADDLAWGIYWVVQTAIVLRLVAALPFTSATWPLLAAIVLWALACCAWSVRYGHWFGLPRKDGRPG